MIRTRKELDKMNNEEWVLDCMRFSDYGMLSQMALIDMIKVGIRETLKHKKEILAQDKEDEKDGKRSFIHMPSWVGVIEELEERYMNKYEYETKTK